MNNTVTVYNKIKTIQYIPARFSQTPRDKQKCLRLEEYAFTNKGKFGTLNLICGIRVVVKWIICRNSAGVHPERLGKTSIEN